MNIVFDYEIFGIEMYEDCLPEEKVALKALWNYVWERIVSFEIEIDKEETSDNIYKAIVICLITEELSIKVVGYSDSLTERITQCFNIQTSQLMLLSIEEALNAFLN